MLFSSENLFSSDISKWDVSVVTNMNGMFNGVELFNGDVSEWDVSSMIDISGMFWGATAFNGDISKWEVSNVGNMMNIMFWYAMSFNQNLCGTVWAQSKASKDGMFEDSSGSISLARCTSLSFSSQSKVELPSAVGT